MFRSTIPSIDYLCQYIPTIKPRLYSIASHPDFVGEKIELCIVVDDWETPAKKYRRGLCSDYLTKITVGSNIVGRISEASIVPPAPDRPAYMVGLGTGIAPLRSAIQERVAQKATGIEVAPMSLLFGSKYRAKDYLY